MQYKKTISVLLVLLVMAFSMLSYQACKNQDSKTKKDGETKESQIDFDSEDGKLLKQAQSIFGLLPDSMPGSQNDTKEMIDLGKKLYVENAISINRTQSCNDCHPIDNGGVGADHEKTGLGALGKHSGRNDPSTLNAGFQVAQFWDGRAATLEDQAQGPPTNPIEMGMPDSNAVMNRLAEIPQYREDFKKAFPNEANPMTYTNFAKAVAAFERTLFTRGKFDKFLAGDIEILSDAEKNGMRKFISAGCIQCHNGPNLGGNTFQKLGVFHAYKNTEPSGREKVTGNPADKDFFKVPMLRNVFRTSPFFHDGGVDNLPEVIDQMTYMQLNKKLKKEEINQILYFLATLTDYKFNGEKFVEDKDGKYWKVPDSTDLAKDPDVDEIKYGYTLLSQTNVHPDTRAFSGNGLACTNCHFEGKAKFGLPWAGVVQSYPKYLAKNNRNSSLEERINSCFERSMNGKPIAVDSKMMKGIIAYMNWLSKSSKKDQKGMGLVEFIAPGRKADTAKGYIVFQDYCQSCHGIDGQGYALNGVAVTPALWGNNSFNIGAGMNRLLTMAPFVYANMPLSTSFNNPVLSVDDAYDVSAYIVSHKRPLIAGLEKDYPDLSKKPVDCPYPPYSDKFTQEQHTYGPFTQMKAPAKK